jgi:hypothetical protein
MQYFSRIHCDACGQKILHEQSFYSDGIDIICEDCKDTYLFVLNDGNYKLISPGNDNPTYTKEV